MAADTPDPRPVSPPSELTADRETRPLGPWHRSEFSDPGDPPHRRPDDGAWATLDVVYADRGRTLPVAANDYDGCCAVILDAARAAPQADAGALREIEKRVRDLTDYPNHGDDETFREGWLAVKQRVLGDIQDIRRAALAASSPATAGREE